MKQACQIIDAVVEKQNRNLHGASGGAFPLAWSEDKQTRGIIDHAAQQFMGTLAAQLASRFPDLLGPRRREALQRAAKLARNVADDAVLAATHQRMLKAWLEVEHGDALVGEELVIELTGQSDAEFAESRFGSALNYGYELWALALWQESRRLESWSGHLTDAIFSDICSNLHPVLGQLLGEGIIGRPNAEGGSAWINLWLTWLALGPEPVMPRDLDNPLDATVLALPALTSLKVTGSWHGGFDGIQRGYEVHRDTSDRRLTGWFERGLHLEACSSESIKPGIEQIMAAYWPVDTGIATLNCRSVHGQSAVCEGRSVRLENSGRAHIQVSGLGKGMTRLIADGWQLPGLQLTCRGFHVSDAQRTEDGLIVSLSSTRDYGLVVFSPEV